MSVDALTLMYGAEQIGLENFYYQMKGGWDIGRCLIAGPPPIGFRPRPARKLQINNQTLADQ